MEKNSPYQLEMFSSENQSFLHRDRSRDNAFFNFIRNYEKAILIIFGMAIVSIISFGLGVEKGKRTASVKFSPRQDMATRIQLLPIAPAGKPKPEVLRPVVTLPQESVEAKEKSTPQFLETQGYVIQLASYKERNLADKEAETLKKKGFNPLVLKKGDYTVLYVGHFANKELASSMLSELRKRYADCIVRRL